MTAVNQATGWREGVLARAAYIRAELTSAIAARESAPVGNGGRPAAASTVAAVRDAVESHLTAAERAAHPGRRFALLSRMRGWWNGAEVDAAWVNLHHAEVILVDLHTDEDLRSRRPAVIALVDQMLQPEDPRRAEAHRCLMEADWSTVTPTLRAGYRSALRWGFVACDEQYARVRSLRNLILAAAALLTLLVIGLAALGALQPRLINLCFSNATPVANTGGGDIVSAVLRPSCPAGHRGPTGGDIFLIELLGLVGGALSAMVAIRGMQGTSTPYAVPVALAVLKLPAGALVSLIGLLLLSGNFLPGLSALDSTEQILAYAVVLGYAQQLVTRLVDRQAHAVLNKVPSSEPTAGPTSAPEPMPRPTSAPEPTPRALVEATEDRG